MSTEFPYDHRTHEIRPPVGSPEWAVEGFLYDRQAAGRSAGTIDFYDRHLRPFLRFLRDEGVTALSQLSASHTRAFFISCQKAGRDNASIRPEAGSIRAFLRWAWQEEHIISAETAAVKVPKMPKRVVEPFTLADVDALIEAAKVSALSERNVAILLTMADTGVRASEVVGLSDRDLDGDRLLIHGKGAKERWVPISPRTRKAIWSWQAARGPSHPSEPLFTTREGRRMERHTLYQLFTRLGDAAGVEHAYPHRMRHTTGTEALRSGMGMMQVKRLLGHESLEMVKRYTESINDDDVAAAHREHSLVDRLESRKKGRKR